eukprot:619787-Rhodomonas_salina.1
MRARLWHHDHTVRPAKVTPSRELTGSAAAWVSGSRWRGSMRAYAVIQPRPRKGECRIKPTLLRGVHGRGAHAWRRCLRREVAAESGACRWRFGVQCAPRVWDRHVHHPEPRCRRPVPGVTGR